MPSLSLFLMAIFIAFGGFFYWADFEGLHGNLVARDICLAVPVGCQNPEWLAYAAAGCLVLFFVSAVSNLRH